MSRKPPSQGFFTLMGTMPRVKDEDTVKTERILRLAQDEERRGPAFTPDIDILEKMRKQKAINEAELKHGRSEYERVAKVGKDAR